MLSIIQITYLDAEHGKNLVTAVNELWQQEKNKFPLSSDEKHKEIAGTDDRDDR